MWRVITRLMEGKIDESEVCLTRTRDNLELKQGERGKGLKRGGELCGYVWKGKGEIGKCQIKQVTR